MRPAPRGGRHSIAPGGESAAGGEAARGEAISYAAYRLLKYRFPVDYVDIDGSYRPVIFYREFTYTIELTVAN